VSKSEYINKSHNVSILLYHLVFPAKYHRAVIVVEVDECLKMVCLEIQKRYELCRGYNANQLVLNASVLELKRPSRPWQTLNNQMAFEFTAITPIAPNIILPAGTIALNGSVQWTRGNLPPLSYNTSTEALLQTEPSCTIQRLVGGIQILTRGTLKVRFAYQPCSTVPIVTKSISQ
jgi:hypothetical protein